MDFIENLIINKAQHLAFYFMINGLVDYSKLKIDILTSAYKKLIINYYEIVKNALNGIQFNRKNFEIIGCLIAEYNNIHSNINRFNYGTEGHIIGFLPDIDETRYLEYLNSYLDYFKTHQNKENLTYTLSEYFKKIGIDIAIYDFLKPLDTTTPKPIDFDKLMNLFFESMKKAYDEYSNKIFFNKMKEVYRKIIDEKEEDSKNMKKKQDKDRIKLLQQYFNLYKYPNKKINNKNIVFYNTVKIKFSDFDSIIGDIYKDKKSNKFQRKLLDIFTIDETTNNLSSKSSKKLDKDIQTSPINKIGQTIETQTSPINKIGQTIETQTIPSDIKMKKFSYSKREYKPQQPIFQLLSGPKNFAYNSMRALKPILEVKSSSLSLSKSMSFDLKTPDKKIEINKIDKYIKNVKNKNNIKKLFKILKDLKKYSYNYRLKISEIINLYTIFITKFTNLLNEKINEDEIEYIKILFDIFSYLFKLFERVKEVKIKQTEYDNLKPFYDKLKALLKEKLKVINLKQYKLNSKITDKKLIKKILKQNLKYYTSLHIIYSKNTVFEKILAYLNQINEIMKSDNLDTTYLQLLKKHYEDIVIKVLNQYTLIPKNQQFLTEFQEIIKDESRFQLFRDNFRQEFSKIFQK
jgi:hypothetical protein